MGSGYTVEGQKTSEEKHGGFQIEVIPEYERCKRYWRKANPLDQDTLEDGSSVIYNSFGLDERKTPEELGCQVGDALRSYPGFPTELGPFKVRDLMGKERMVQFRVCPYRLVSRLVLL